MTISQTISQYTQGPNEKDYEFIGRISKDHNLKFKSVERIFYKDKNHGEHEKTESKKDRDLLLKTISDNEKEYIGSITNPEEILQALDLDPEVWEVKDFEIQSSNWDVTSKYRDQDLKWHENTKREQIMEGHAIRKNEFITKENKAYKVKARIVRKASKGVEDIFKATIEMMRKYAQPVPLIIQKAKHNKCISIINLFDAHIDKLALQTETGVNSDIDENIALFEKYFDELLQKELLNNPELIYFPVGSDFWNVNYLGQNTTKKGTPQDVMLKPCVSFPLGIRVMRNCIDKAKQHCKVMVPVIRGNHDDDQTFYAGQCLSIAYEHDENVTIDDSRINRKYYAYGVTVLGFAHGNYEKRRIDEFPARALVENREHMVKCNRIEMFLGDIHHKQEVKFMRTKDFPGVTMRFLRSIGTTDQYHHDNGYVGIPKTAESFKVEYNKGLTGNNMVSF